MKTSESDGREIKFRQDIIDSIQKHDLKNQEIVDVLCSFLLDNGVYVNHTTPPTYSVSTKFRRKQCEAFHKINGPLPRRM